MIGNIDFIRMMLELSMINAPGFQLRKGKKKGNTTKSIPLVSLITAHIDNLNLQNAII